MDLRTSAELAELLRLPTPSAAEKKARELGVQPYAFGRGRGKGNRWDWIEVQEALRGTRNKKQPRPRAVHSDLFDLPVNEIVRRLTAGAAKQ